MKKLLTLLLTICIVCTLSACGGSGSSGQGGGYGVSTDEIVIGYVGPITGPYAGLGLAIHKITEWAVEQLNKDGGIAGVPVKYVYRDDTGDATKSANYVKELVEREGVQIMIGSPNSTSVSAALDYLTENKIVTILCSASAVNLINETEYPYMFRTQVNNDTMAEALVKNAIKGEFKNVVLIGDNSTLGSDGIAAMEKYAEQYGLKFADVIQYVPGTVDQTPVAQAIASVNADCVTAFGTGVDAATIVSALDRIGMTGKYLYLGYMGTALANFAELAGAEPTQYVLYQGLKCGSIAQGDDNPDLGYSQKWYDTMYEIFGDFKLDGSGRTWGWIEAGRAYDCVNIFKQAIEKANSIDPDEIKKAIESIGKFESVLYESGYSFSEDNHEGFDVNELACCYMGQYVYDIGSLKGEPITVRNTKFD